MESLTRKATVGHWAALGSVTLLMVGISWAMLVPSGLVDPDVIVWAHLAQLCAVSLGISAILTLTAYACGSARKRGLLIVTVGLTICGIVGSLLQDRLGQLAVSTIFLMSVPAGLVAARPGDKRRIVLMLMGVYLFAPILAVCLARVAAYLLGAGGATELGSLTVYNMVTVTGPWAPLVRNLLGQTGPNLPFSTVVAVALTVLMALNFETALRAKRTDIPGLCLIFHVPFAFAWVATGVIATTL